MFLSHLSLYGIDATSIWVYTLMLAGVLSFVLGTFLFSFCNKTPENSDSNNNGTSGTCFPIRKQLVWFLIAISLALFAKIAFSSMQLLARGYTLEYVREIYQNADNNETTGRLSLLESGLYSYICVPFLYAIIPVASFNIIKKCASKKFIIAVSLMTLFYILGCAGRMIIVYILLAFFVSASLNKKKYSIDLKKIIIIVLLSILGTYFFFMISGNRGITDMQKSLYLYFCGPIPHFEYRADLLTKDRMYFYGMSTAKGYLIPVLSLLNATHLFPYPKWFNSMLSYVSLQDRISIGNDNTINAFATCFYNFYSDFRLPGIIIGMFIYGIVAQAITEKAYKNRNNAYYASIFIFMIFGVLGSMIRFQVVITSYAYTYIFLVLLFSRGSTEGIDEKDNSQYYI